MVVIKKHKRVICFWLTQLIILIPKIIISLNAIPCTDVRDEVAMLKVPAYLAGYDWSQSTESASYYGFGFFALFFPLFLWQWDIVTIYRTILIITSVVECIVPFICYYLMEQYWDVKDDIDKMLITIIASLTTVNPPYNLINEHILSVMMWVIVLILCKLISEKNGKRKNILSFFLMLCLIYSLTIHARALVFIIAVLAVIAIYFFIYREWLVTKIFSITFLLFYIGVDFFISHVQEVVWGSNNLVNSSVTIPKNINWIDCVESFFDIVLGNIGGIFIFSKSFCGFLIVAILLYFIEIMKKKYRTNNKNAVCEKTFWTVAIFSVVCIAITIGGLGIQHMKGVEEAVSEGNVNSYSFKYLVYIRYYIVYAAPLFMLGLILYIKNVVYYRKTFTLGFILTIIVYVMWGSRIVPYISNTYFGVNNFYTFAWLLGKTALDRISSADYWVIIIFSIDLAVLLFCSLMGKRHKNLFISLMAVLMIYQYIYFPFHYSDIVSESQYNKMDAIQKFVEEEREKNKDIIIYVYEEADILSYLLQVYNYDMQVVSGLPDKEEKGIIIVSDENIDDKLLERCEGIELDKNEWVYTLR